MAMWQARWVAERLAVLLPETSVEIVEVPTRGDAHSGPFTGLSERGLFTSDVEVALVEGRIDVAVHSLKDLPVTTDGALSLAAVPLRDDPRDALVSREGLTLASLPEGARVGTSSPRRACLIRSRRPDAEIVALRGNVGTRVRRVEEGHCDAAVLAAAGLKRLGLDDKVSEWLDPRDFPPAPGQGALAVQVREEHAELHGVVSGMDDPEARETSSAERSLLEALGGGCAMPVGAHAWRTGDGLALLAFVGSADGRTILRAEVAGEAPEALAKAAAESLLLEGAAALLS